MNSRSAIKNFTSLVDQECDIINQVEKDIDFIKHNGLRLPFIEKKLPSIRAKLKDLMKIKTEFKLMKANALYILVPTSTKKRKFLQLEESNKKLELQKGRIYHLLWLQKQMKTGKKDDIIQKKVCALCKCCQLKKQRKEEKSPIEKSSVQMNFTSAIAQINQVCDTLDNDIQQIANRFSSLREKVDAIEPLSNIVPFIAPKKNKLCHVCGVKCKKRCRNCSTYYCGPEHQNQDWKKHKKVCKTICSV
jgi:hypothetical protein